MVHFQYPRKWVYVCIGMISKVLTLGSVLKVVIGDLIWCQGQDLGRTCIKEAPYIMPASKILQYILNFVINSFILTHRWVLTSSIRKDEKEKKNLISQSMFSTIQQELCHLSNSIMLKITNDSFSYPTLTPIQVVLGCSKPFQKWKAPAFSKTRYVVPSTVQCRNYTKVVVLRTVNRFRVQSLI